MEEQERTHQPITDHDHHGHNRHGHNHHGHNHHGFTGIEQWIARLDNPAREEKQFPNQVIAKLQLMENDVVADIGAGTGYFALRMAEAHPQVRVLAADAEPEMIAYLKSQSVKRKLANLEPVLIDPAKPVLPVKADLAFIVDTYHHIHNRIEYLKALGENLAPGARIAIIDYPLEAPEGPPADHRVSITDVIAELKQVEFVLDQQHEFLPNQYFLIFKQR